MAPPKSNLDLSGEQWAELDKLLQFYVKEIERCRRARAYLAACAVAGAQLEAMLLMAVSAYCDEVEATGKIPRSHGKPKPLIKWSLGELLTIAKAADWLPAGLDLDEDWDDERANIGDYAEVVRLLRNLLHPGNHLQEYSGERVKKRHLERVLEIIDVVAEVLAERNNRSLREWADTEGLLDERSGENKPGRHTARKRSSSGAKGRG